MAALMQHYDGRQQLWRRVTMDPEARNKPFGINAAAGQAVRLRSGGQLRSFAERLEASNTSRHRARDVGRQQGCGAGSGATRIFPRIRVLPAGDRSGSVNGALSSKQSNMIGVKGPSSFAGVATLLLQGGRDAAGRIRRCALRSEVAERSRRSACRRHGRATRSAGSDIRCNGAICRYGV